MGAPRSLHIAVRIPTRSTVLAHEVAVFLVAEGLERRGVDDPALGGQCLVDGKLRDQGLAGPGWRRDQNRLTAEDPTDGLLLEWVQRERIALAEGIEECLILRARRSRSGRIEDRGRHGHAGLAPLRPVAWRDAAPASACAVIAVPACNVCDTPMGAQVGQGPQAAPPGPVALPPPGGGHGDRGAGSSHARPSLIAWG
jgi:hypothetical protein